MSGSRPRLAALVLPALACAAIAQAALGPRYGGRLVLSAPEVSPAVGGAGPWDGARRTAAALGEETLVRLGDEGFPTPALAAGWTVASGSREWTLRLAEGARFHDGRPVDAADAERTLRAFLRSNSAAGAALADALDGGAAFRAKRSDELPGLSSPAPGRLVLRLREPRALPLAALSAPAAALHSPSGAGAGPFAPMEAPAAGRQVLSAFAGHVGGRPFLDEVEVRGAESDASRADAAPGEGGPTAAAGVLLLVLEPRGPLAAAEARQAMVAALEPENLARLLWRGADPLPFLLPPALLPLLPAGEDAAAAPPRLEAGATLTLVVDRQVPRLLSQRVEALLGVYGLRVHVHPSEPSEAWTRPAHARLLVWLPEVAEAELALRELAGHASGDAAVEEALAAAAVELDRDRRRKRLHLAEDALRKLQVLVPLATVPVGWRTVPRLHDARIDASGVLRLEDAWVWP